MARARRPTAVSRHLHESSPGEKAVGGLISDFEAVRTATVPSAQVVCLASAKHVKAHLEEQKPDGMKAASLLVVAAAAS